MSADASLEFDWADGTYKFRLGLGEIRELQEKTKVGPRRLWMRIRSGEWFVDDLREAIRLGLIGGGMEPVNATKLVRRYVDARPLAESVEPSMKILTAMLVGVPDDPVGKTQAAEDANKTNTNVSPSPQSTN